MHNVLVAHSRDGLGGSVITGALLAKAVETGGEWKTLSVCNSSGPPLDYHKSIGVEVLPLMASQGFSYRPNANDGNRLRRIFKRTLLFLAARRFLKSSSPEIIPDIIHVHDESSALAWGLAARTKGIPLVWQVHTQLPQPWIDWLLRRLSAHMIFVAANNKVRFNGTVLPANSVIYNGVDLARFYPAPRKAETGTVTIGFVSNLRDSKRPEWLVRAAGTLVQEGLDVKVLVAGADFTGSKAAELQSLAERQGLAGRYTYLGPRSDVPDVLRSLDILVLASERDKEAFPRIIVEAMACGLPVLATAVAGIPEAVIDGETGSLVEPEDFDGFVDRLRTLARDAELRRRYGAAAAKRCRAIFSMEANVAGIEQVYRIVTAQRNQQSQVSSFA